MTFIMIGKLRKGRKPNINTAEVGDMSNVELRRQKYKRSSGPRRREVIPLATTPRSPSVRINQVHLIKVIVFGT